MLFPSFILSFSLGGLIVGRSQTTRTDTRTPLLLKHNFDLSSELQLLLHYGKYYKPHLQSKSSGRDDAITSLERWVLDHSGM